MSKTTHLDKRQRTTDRFDTRSRPDAQTALQASDDEQDSICSNCGLPGHWPGSRYCRALGRTCNKCGIIGQFACVCRSTRHNDSDDDGHSTSGVSRNWKSRPDYKRTTRYKSDSCDDSDSSSSTFKPIGTINAIHGAYRPSTPPLTSGFQLRPGDMVRVRTQGRGQDRECCWSSPKRILNVFGPNSILLQDGTCWSPRRLRLKQPFEAGFNEGFRRSRPQDIKPRKD